MKILAVIYTESPMCCKGEGEVRAEVWAEVREEVWAEVQTEVWAEVRAVYDDPIA